MAPRGAAPAAALMDELLEEILLRIPPDDPARLLHAALVCKRWGRIVSDPRFRRRFREFHSTPPMLGFFHERWRSYSFVSTSSFRRPPAALLNSYYPIDARHGRVLLCNSLCKCVAVRIPLGYGLTVWDPITGKSSKLPLPPPTKHPATWNAAVLCASTGRSCDHLDCGCEHFFVVLVCKSMNRMFTHVYSSETAAWSEEILMTSTCLPQSKHLHMNTLPSALVGNALYFVCSRTVLMDGLAAQETVLKYDLAAQEMSLIPLPCLTGSTILRTEGGRLGLANISSDGLHLYLWSREVGPDEDVGWTQNKVIKLRKLFPDVDLGTLRLTGFAHGLDVILVGSSEGTFTIDLKSVRATKVHGEGCGDFCFPFMSFYTPGTRALGAASAEGSGTGTSDA